jgi:hypothetical protein
MPACTKRQQVSARLTTSAQNICMSGWPPEKQAGDTFPKISFVFSGLNADHKTGTQLA